MAESMLQKVQNEAKAFVIAPIYPFLQKDWWAKMWIFAALSYVPILNVIIARGWRMDYIRRLGWREERVLPSSRDLLKFLINGLLLWIGTGVFLSIPLLIIIPFGFGGLIDLWGDIVSLFTLVADYFFNQRLSTAAFLSSLWTFIVGELISEVFAFLIENIWLVIYVPIYRIGMIRFALTGNFIRSHLSIVKNIKFLFRNFIDILLMYTFNIFNFALVIIVDAILSLTVVGVPLIPIITFFMPYWNSGYEYGLLARAMIEQEDLTLAPQRVITSIPTVQPILQANESVVVSHHAANGLQPNNCHHCGVNLVAPQQFCMNCGTPLRTA